MQGDVREVFISSIKPHAEILANEKQPKPLLKTLDKIIKMWNDQRDMFKEHKAAGERIEAAMTLTRLETCMRAMMHCEVFQHITKLLMTNRPMEVRLRAVDAISTLCNQVANNNDSQISYFARQNIIGMERFEVEGTQGIFTGMSLLYLIIGDKKVSEKIRANGARALWNVVHKNPQTRKETTLWKDFMKSLLDLFDPTVDKSLRINIMGLTKELLLAQPTNQERFKNFNGILKVWELLAGPNAENEEVIIKYMLCHVLKSALWTANVEERERRRGPLLKEGAVNWVYTKCGKLHKECEGDVELQNLLAAYLSVLAVLSGLNVSIQNQLTQNGLAELIRDLLDPKLKNQELRTQCCSVIAAFYPSTTYEFYIRFGSNGGLMKLLNIMSQEKNIMGMYSAWCAMVNVCMSEDNFKLVEVQYQMLPPVLNILNRVCMNIAKKALPHLPNDSLKYFVSSVHHLLSKAKPDSKLKHVFIQAGTLDLLNFLCRLPPRHWGGAAIHQKNILELRTRSMHCLSRIFGAQPQALIQPTQLAAQLAATRLLQQQAMMARAAQNAQNVMKNPK